MLRFFCRSTTTTLKPPKRARPPFLRPIAKFTDIKIPALENIGKKQQNNNAPVDDITDKDKQENDNDKKKLKFSLFERPRVPSGPLNAILRHHRTSTTTTTTTTSTTTTESGKTTWPKIFFEVTFEFLLMCECFWFLTASTSPNDDIAQIDPKIQKLL